MKVWALNFGVSDNLGARKGYLLGNHFDCGSNVINSYYNYYGDIGTNWSYLHNSNKNYILVMYAVLFKKNLWEKRSRQKVPLLPYKWYTIKKS